MLKQQRLERNDEMVAEQKEPEKKQNGADQNICMDKLRCLAFITMVNCAVGGSQKELRWCWTLPGDS